MANQVPDNAQVGPLVAEAVERMAAAEIAVGLRSLAVIGLYGLVQFLRHGVQPPDYLMLMIGAVLSMVAMVAYGLQAVARVLEKPTRWGGLVFAGSFLPVLFAGYVIVTRVLYLLALGVTSGVGSVLINVGLLTLAVMCVRAQWKLIEVHRLAAEMAGVGGVALERGAP